MNTYSLMNRLALLEGMSEAVEFYVSIANVEADCQVEEPVTKRETFYLTSDSHKLVRSQKIVETGNSGDQSGIFRRMRRKLPGKQYRKQEF